MFIKYGIVLSISEWDGKFFRIDEKITFTWNENYVENFLKVTLQSGRLHKIAVFIDIEKFTIKHF